MLFCLIFNRPRHRLNKKLLIPDIKVSIVRKFQATDRELITKFINQYINENNIELDTEIVINYINHYICKHYLQLYMVGKEPSIGGLPPHIMQDINKCVLLHDAHSLYVDNDSNKQQTQEQLVAHK